MQRSEGSGTEANRQKQMKQSQIFQFPAKLTHRNLKGQCLFNVFKEYVLRKATLCLMEDFIIALAARLH